MINKLDEKLKKYSHEYFIKEFMKSKPNPGYKKLKNKYIWLLVSFCIVIALLVLSVIYSSQWGARWYYWGVLSLFFCLLVAGAFLGKLECRKTTVLSKSAATFLEKHKDLKKKIQDCDPLTTRKKKKQYIDSIINSYRADIVKQYLNNDYNINTIKAIKDETSIKEFKYNLDFIAVCALVALSVSFITWLEIDIQNGWPIAVLGFLILLLCYFVSLGIKLAVWLRKHKKYKILRETLSFILYDYI